MKTVSIIVPVYNVEKYLRRCLESIACQTLHDFECIIVNDGSPDDSQMIIDEFVEKFPHIFKCIQKENGGLSDARNVGLRHAQADYVGFIDSDDYIECTMFEKLYLAVKSNAADIAVCDFSMDYELEQLSYDIKGVRTVGVDQKKNLLISPGSAWNKLYKKELFVNYEIYYPKGMWYEDLATTAKLILHSQKITYVNESLLHYIQRDGSIMNTISPKIFDIYKAVESIENYYKKYQLFERYEQEIEYMFIENLVLYASIRFLNLPSPDDEREVIRLLTYMKEKFPKWIRNPYIKTLGKKDQLTLRMLYYKQVKGLKILIKLVRKLKK